MHVPLLILKCVPNASVYIGATSSSCSTGSHSGGTIDKQSLQKLSASDSLSASETSASKSSTSMPSFAAYSCRLHPETVLELSYISDKIHHVNHYVSYASHSAASVHRPKTFHPHYSHLLHCQLFKMSLVLTWIP